jgi:hypothetical protein
MSPRPVVAVLVTHWDSDTEEGWLIRQVAGALACAADVHVVTPDSGRADITVDGVFSVHYLGTPVEEVAELRRDLLVEGISTTVTRPEELLDEAVTSLLDQDLIAPWDGATEVLARLQPSLVVVAGHQNIGAVKVVDRYDHDAAVNTIALGSNLHSLVFPHFVRHYSRSRSVLAVTQAEHNALVGVLPAPEAAYVVGAPLAANPNAWMEPDQLVGSSDYVLVLTHTDSEGGAREAELAQLLRTAAPERRVAIAHTDAFMVWQRGRVVKGPPIERSGDLARVMAWARATVDLRPGRLFARPCLESLLYGTPIVVPHDSRAREHADVGRGGLWFENPAELTWCVEAMFDPAIRESFSARGRAYAERDFGSTDRFIEQVLVACALKSERLGDSDTETASLAG